jgi:hypothetical protein
LVLIVLWGTRATRSRRSRRPSKGPIVRKRITQALLSLVVVGVPASAYADDAPASPPTPTKDAGGPTEKAKIVVGDAGKRPPGWTPGIAIGATFNLNDSRNVVGQQDGTAFTLGAAIDASLEWNHGMHEWRNNLRAAAGATRAPALGEFVKTADGLRVESIYLLHALEAFGPFARFGLDTNMFPALDIRPAAVSYVVANRDGTTTAYTGRRLALTDAFKPLTLKESLGVFTQPVNDDHIKFEARAGLGAQETWADGQLAVDDDAKTTDKIEVKALNDFYELGAEGVANAWGAIDKDKRVSYTVGAGLLVPFAHTALAKKDTRGVSDLINVDVNAGLHVKVFDWASVDYKLAVTRQPLLVDAWQVTNALLFTIGAAWGSKAPAPPEPPKCDCEKPPEEPKASDPSDKPAAPPAPAAPPPAVQPPTPAAPSTPPPPPAAPAPAAPPAP